ncbi:MAG: hypothetical protein JKY96_01545 [Phycisphaerales bacterium]|nr:hypothetical protein [Phycisphaerales bacterium]
MDKQGRSSTDQAAIHIDGEHETSNGWLYTFHIDWSDGQRSDHELTLSWVDHEHLVGGAVSPSVVAAVVARIASAHCGHKGMPARCDVSILRRQIAGFDEMVKAG